jgi:tetratricopeptide (TPR) repeat protein
MTTPEEAAARRLETRFDRLWKTDLREAAQVATSLRRAASRSRDSVVRAIALRVDGHMDHYRGASKLAPAKLVRAAALYRRAGRPLDEADVLRSSIDVYAHLGRDRQALAAAATARAIYAAHRDALRLGKLAVNVGNLHQRRGELAAARRAYSEARRRYATTGTAVTRANVDFNEANVLEAFDRLVEARPLYERALAAYESEKLSAFAARAEFAIAELDVVEGFLDRGLERLEHARVRHLAVGDRVGAAHCDLEASEALLRLNRPAEAGRVADRALGVFRPARHDTETASCLGVMGCVSLQEGRPARAATLLRQAQRRELAVANMVGAALHGVGVAQAELLRGRPRAAVAEARRSAAAFGSRKLLSRQARAMAVAAEGLRRTGDARGARRTAGGAVVLARKRGDRRSELAARLILARIEKAAGRNAAAFAQLTQAERCVERMRRGVTSEESRLAFALDKIEVYEALVDNRLGVGTRRAVKEALLFAERGKARALAERLSEGRPVLLDRGSSGAKRLLARLDAVERKLAVAEARLDDDGATPGLRGMRATQVASLSSARWATLNRLAHQDPRGATLLGARVRDPLAALGPLTANEMVLEYAQSGDRFHLFVVERTGVTAHRSIAGVAEVGAVAALLRFQLGKGVLGDDHAERFGPFLLETLKTYLDALHRMLLSPVDGRLDGKVIRIVPHGLLHGLPFHAFERGGVPLIERATVSYAPSLTVLGLLGRRGAAQSAVPLVLGIPDRSAPEIEAEVDALRRHLGGARFFRGKAATADAMRLCEMRPPLLHVASHGFFSEDGAQRAGLKLGDVWLSLDDIYTLRGAGALTVLSGCETGRGSVYSGDEWVGLVRGFLQAGARTVVASLWEVHDKSAVAQMDDFYAGLNMGLPVGEALAEAQRAARRRDPLPLRWAPFMVIGDPRLKLASSRRAA